ncbi:MAG: hypothetical protein J3Q66DRAFT_344753 [Benniella sp.]|nr:MAG: hypothetical protein J3Q66DRAFT_344753 [Benniella sp.]
MNRVIDRSQGLTYLRLSLENLDQGQQQQKAHDLLRRHKDRLTSLHMTGYYFIDSYLSGFANNSPRDAFPALEEFFAESTSHFMFDNRAVKSMVSAPQHQQTPLKVLGLKILYYAYQWEEVIRAIDLSALEELHFYYHSYMYGFSERQLQILVDRIMGSDASSLPLRLLSIDGQLPGDGVIARELFVRLREAIPNIEIKII